MKNVRMTSSFAGIVNMPAGSIQQLVDDDAARLVDQGHAVFLETEDTSTKAEVRSTRTVKAKEKR